MKPALLGVVAVLLLTACGDPPATPTPIPEPTPTWGALPSAPDEVTAEEPQGEITIEKVEGETIFPVRLVGRSSRAQQGIQGRELKYIVFQVEFRNNTGHDISKSSGTIYFNDSGGTFIDGDRVEEVPAMKAGESVTIMHDFLDTDTVKSRATLRETPLRELQVVYRPQYINYANGVSQRVIYEQ
jgi:hypothetical protein